MSRTAIHAEAEVAYEQFIDRERGYFFSIATEDERAASVDRIVGYLVKYPETPLQTLCKDIAGRDWNALRVRVQRAQGDPNAQVDDVLARTSLAPERVRSIRSAISRAPDEVVASLSDEQLDALQAAVVERRGLRPRAEPARRVDVDQEKEAEKHECENCWFHCPSGGRYASG